YPDGWDSLMSGSDLWAAGVVSGDATTSVRGLHRELSGTDPKLIAGTLTDSDVTALQRAGINTLLSVNTAAASSIRPGDMFTVPVTVATGGAVAMLNPATSGGKKVIDHVYRANLRSGGVSGTIPSGAKLVVFGFGPQNAMIGKSVMEAPTYGN